MKILDRLFGRESKQVAPSFYGQNFPAIPNKDHQGLIGLPQKPNKKYPCVEVTLDITLGERIVRLWINHDQTLIDGEVIPDSDAFASVESMADFIAKESGLELLETSYLVKELIRIVPNLNAVQILDTHSRSNVRYGLVVYTVEFNDPVHG